MRKSAMNKPAATGIAAIAMMIAAIPATAQAPIRTERVQFDRGASAATLRGTIKGYDSVDYLLTARAGQTLSVALRAMSGSVYFNLLPPRSEEAIFNGSIAGARYEGRLPVSGDYRVRVYQMRSTARRGERASYSLALAIAARPGGGAALPQPGGAGRPIPPTAMPAFCRGEAARQYGVRPPAIRTSRIVANGRGSLIDGTADQGRYGVKRFQCRFDSRGRFIDVMALTRDGV